MQTVGDKVAHVSIAVSINPHGLEKLSPQLCARVAAIARVETECDGATVLNAFDDTGVNIRSPAIRFSEVIVDEESNDALNGSELIACVKRVEEV